MSSQNNNKLYQTSEDRANTVFDAKDELYRMRAGLLQSKNYWATEIYTEPAKHDLMEEYNTKFYDWLKKEWGIQVEVYQFEVRGISGYKVLDQQKFLMFMLRFYDNY